VSIEATIRDYITQNLLFSEDTVTYEDDSSFLEKGIIDSLGVTELVTYVSSNWGIAVSPEDVIPENFDSVRRVADYIRRRQAAGVAA